MKFTPPVAAQEKLAARLFKSVHDGKSNTAMGAWREALTDDEIWVLAPTERDLILDEMRMHLKTVHGVVSGLTGQNQAAKPLSGGREPARSIHKPADSFTT